MTILRYLTAGESHGRALVGVIEGIPAGLSLSAGDIDGDLKRRQMGYGRGGRMRIESDHAEILSGVRWGRTIGSPITLFIENTDYKNWLQGMSPDPEADDSIPALIKPRPGHADLSGAIKYNHHDMRNILERSSARETAVRVALGAIAKKFLSEFDIIIGSYVVQIGGIRMHEVGHLMRDDKKMRALFAKAEKSPVRCPDVEGSKKMVKLIDRAMKEGNSLGGIFEVFMTGVPVGIGSHIQWDMRLDGRLGQALMSIQAIKGVEIGLGFEMGKRFGSEVMDEIFYESSRSKVQSLKFYRKTNNAGGIEGGMTNGMPIILRAAMKPIPTLRKPLRSVDIVTKKQVKAAYERSDICAAPAAAVIGEAMVALTLADAFLEKFGGDSVGEVKRNYDSYVDYTEHF
jgi:chorismate synthase